MSKHYIVRRAQPTLAMAEGILRVEQQSLADSPYSANEILDVMRRPEHLTYVALCDARIVGFCSSFVTLSQQGAQLELDMLAVFPEHRCRGLGTRLLSQSMADAQSRNVGRFHGVVAGANVASKRTFVRAGLAPANPLSDMLVYQIRGAMPVDLPSGATPEVHGDDECPLPASGGQLFGARGPNRRLVQVMSERGNTIALAECQFVYTFSYQGVWVERVWVASQSAHGPLARAIVEWAKTTDADEVGYLMPREETRTGLQSRLAWVRQGYEDAGPHVVFVRKVESATSRASSS